MSPSSGGAAHDQGDVRTQHHLIECKHTGQFNKPAKSISVKLADFEKIVDEAWAENREPMMALSLYAPGSPLADNDGYVDLTVRVASSDAEMDDDLRRYTNAV